MIKLSYLAVAVALAISNSSFAAVPKGSGIPIYALDYDLQCQANGICQSKEWATELASQSAANIKYIYPNYPYINYFVNIDPVANKAKMQYLANTNCNDMPYVFIDYNVYPQGSKSCYAKGSAANTAYNTNNDYLILPTFSFDTSLVAAANACYNKSGDTYTFTAKDCYIPCDTDKTGKNPLFPANPKCIYNAKAETSYLNITSKAELEQMVEYTGQLVGMIIAADSTAAGSSFDIEGPPFIPVLADKFYDGLIDQTDNKLIGVWRGVNIFGRDSQDFTTLNKLAANNGFLILSMYDIGPDDDHTPIGNKDFRHDGGLEVANPPLWYAGNPIQTGAISPILLPGSGGYSNYSAFDIMLFGTPSVYQNKAFFDCHPKELMMSKTGNDVYHTGFNGCTGSASYIQRFMQNDQLDIPFQVGIPAMSSTTEWVHAVAWAPDSTTIDSLEITTSITGSTWINSSSCHTGLKIDGYSCKLFSLKPDYQSSSNSQVDYLDYEIAGDNNKHGALNILASYINASPAAGKSPDYSGETLQTALTQVQSYLSQNFMGLYIYGLKPSNFDKTNCEYQLNVKGKNLCFANYPNNQFNNDISTTVWQAIAKFNNDNIKD